MAPSIAAYLTIIFALITVVNAAASSTGYHNHTVGGASGWLFNSTTSTAATNYTTWASTQTFNLGDFLIFKTNTNQTVVHTYNETAYLSCDADDSDNGTFVYDSGSTSFGEALTTSVPLTIVGSNYFFSDEDDGVQCRHGLAFQINVNRGQGLPPSLNQPPPPPYIEPPGPDAADQSPPSTMTVSPTGGASALRVNALVAVCGFAAAKLILLR
ncbi:hypothetical protein PIB30_023489 [Stylosanthes scabra]|uniref:Phytocyanin domain-containing protein n=1 Tax=Stylosanthes scabra TaxID=79078 RepID=A0ABU6S9I7_9FABA|nr:hypothetical protein [Stylosanthes scabra]